MLKDPFKLEKIAAKTWCGPGEKLLWRIGPRWGHVAFDVAGRRGAPHQHDGGTRSSTVPEWPLPTEAVATGRYHGDEWVHDPSIWAYVHAPHPSAVAAGCADGLVAGQTDAWLVLSDQRLAVVVAASAIDEPAKKSGWLSRGKSEEETLRSLWEAPIAAIRHFGALQMGREVEPVWIGQVAFQDGSTVLIRMENEVAAESVVTAGNAIFGG
ncbi:hypothetical protein [Saccharopolyspora sp. NPDC002686]|uniref:hypothetical protein n=1 Tax=Saccharopolyspora sp. NPDC002686 TaxID=3154541 RepID=UPI00331A363C